ncbi:glycosyltransferase family 4 protein [Streptomyces sp. NPDC091272]|uniref:glycosyltransferase family 4 protein n=1 Tax=Streptomyces sp. NPDC091272 TaxID=3365981 RepID=UPI0037FFB59C
MKPLKVALVNIPLRVPGSDKWITVPPQGYGGIQWVVANLMDGLLELGHEVFLLGAPGSLAGRPGLTVVPVGEPQEIQQWLRTSDVDVVHDHSGGVIGPAGLPPATAFLSSHHFTTRAVNPVGCTYSSRAQRAHCGGGDDAPVIPIPVDPARYRPAGGGVAKEDFLLFLGRVSPHKGALEAAAFAHACGVRLVLGGPVWEPEYFEEITRRYGSVVEPIGEVGGERRLGLLASARAVLVMSQPVTGPWGGVWCEPGATVVSEAAASGTPVVGTGNGCLAEIVPSVGRIVDYGTGFAPDAARGTLEELPAPDEVRSAAERLWGHVSIAGRYVEQYRRLLSGVTWK